MQAIEDRRSFDTGATVSMLSMAPREREPGAKFVMLCAYCVFPVVCWICYLESLADRRFFIKNFSPLRQGICCLRPRRLKLSKNIEDCVSRGGWRRPPPTSKTFGHPPSVSTQLNPESAVLRYLNSRITWQAVNGGERRAMFSLRMSRPCLGLAHQHVP